MNSYNADAYFKQTQWGESRWWSWLLTLWFTIIGWIVLSGIIGAPIPEVVRPINPELVEVYYQKSTAFMSTVNTAKLGLLSLGFLVFAVMGSVLWLIGRLSKSKVSSIMFVVAGLCMLLSTILLFMLYPMVNDAEINAAFMELIGASPVAYALMLASFPALLVGLYLCQKFIHGRTLTSLHTGAAQINWARMIFAIGVTWAVLGGLAIIMHVTGISPLKSTFDPSRFLGFAIATLIFIPLQSGTEEIFFRGYLNQGFGHFIPNKWVVFIITSILFATMHLSNPEALAGAEEGGMTHLLVMSQYFLFGFILSVIVYFEGGLEAAIGVHAGNNMFAAMFVNYEGSVLPTPSLFLSTPNPGTDAPMTMLILSLIAYILYKTKKDIIPAPEPMNYGKPKDVF